MTQKEELEILRGEPIQVFTGAPMDIPCIETSDPERLCKNPVVSVHMITYNHEPYIRESIEGVMMQKTDFEFELVIGEDASTDRTREICLEYQKRYPEKIRVLWWRENLYRSPHPAGSNNRRNIARCRGEYIAYCEGDDYWTDSDKLQKQVDVLRAHPNVSLCFTGARVHEISAVQDVWSEWNAGHVGYTPGLIPARKFALWTMFGKDPPGRWGSEYFIMTCTVMLRQACLQKAYKEDSIWSWRWRVGDAVVCLGMASLGDAWYLDDITSVYRRTQFGITHTDTTPVAIDSLLTRIYYLKRLFGEDSDVATSELISALVFVLLNAVVKRGRAGQRTYIRRILRVKSVRAVFVNRKFWLAIPILYLNLMTRFTLGCLLRIWSRWPYRHFSKKLQKMYEVYV